MGCVDAQQKSWGRAKVRSTIHWQLAHDYNQCMPRRHMRHNCPFQVSDISTYIKMFQIFDTPLLPPSVDPNVCHAWLDDRALGLVVGSLPLNLASLPDPYRKYKQKHQWKWCVVMQRLTCCIMCTDLKPLKFRTAFETILNSRASFSASSKIVLISITFKCICFHSRIWLSIDPTISHILFRCSAFAWYVDTSLLELLLCLANLGLLKKHGPTLHKSSERYSIIGISKRSCCAWSRCASASKVSIDVGSTSLPMRNMSTMRNDVWTCRISVILSTRSNLWHERPCGKNHHHQHSKQDFMSVEGRQCQVTILSGGTASSHEYGARDVNFSWYICNMSSNLREWSRNSPRSWVCIGASISRLQSDNSLSQLGLSTTGPALIYVENLIASCNWLDQQINAKPIPLCHLTQ